MTTALIVRCDGTPADRPGMALERCRAFLPLPLVGPVRLAELANAAGYRVLRDRHLCPACAREAGQ